MTALLLDAARRYAEHHADANGLAEPPICGLTILRDTGRGALQYAISRPLVAIVLQGAKRVMLGSSAFDFGAGDSLLITADVATVSQITRASLGAPSLALVVELDLAVVADLVTEIGPAPFMAGTPARRSHGGRSRGRRAAPPTLARSSGISPGPPRPACPRTPLLAAVGAPWRRYPRAGHARQPCPTHRPRRRHHPGRVRPAATGRAAGASGRDERFGVPPAFP